MADQEQWSFKEVAAFLGVEQSTVRAYRTRGEMPPPDGRVSNSPWWWRTTIEGWERPGHRRPRPQSAKFGVKSSPLTEAIYVGRLNKAGTGFLDKEAATDLVLGTVGEYVRDNYAGGMTAGFPGLGFDLDVKVTPRDDIDSKEAGDE